MELVPERGAESLVAVISGGPTPLIRWPSCRVIDVQMSGSGFVLYGGHLLGFEEREFLEVKLITWMGRRGVVAPSLVRDRAIKCIL
jgi:hypothetical protein